MLVFFFYCQHPPYEDNSIYLYIYHSDWHILGELYTLNFKCGSSLLLSFTIVENYCYHDCNQTFKLIFFLQILGSLNNWHKKRHHSKYDRTKQMLWHQNISTLTLSISKMNWREFEFFFFPLFFGLKTLHTTYVYVYVIRCTYCSTCR